MKWKRLYSESRKNVIPVEVDMREVKLIQNYLNKGKPLNDPSNKECLKNLVRTTHRRDLYEYLVASYARQRGWDEKETVQQAVALLDRFEHRRFKL